MLVFVQPESAAAPAPEVRLTLSDVTPSPGQYVAVWCGNGPPSYRVRVYIDSRSNQVGSMTTSASGYGRATFKLSRYAKVGSRHSVILLLDAKSGSTIKRAFTVASTSR